MSGNVEASVMVAAPRLGAKVMVSAPAAALASRIAWRNDPVPLSFRFVTVNVAAVRRRDTAGAEGQRQNGQDDRP